MDENKYRLCKIILLTIFTIGAVVIGWRASQEGRFVQYDYRKQFDPAGEGQLVQFLVIDTWTGERLEPTR